MIDKWFLEDIEHLIKKRKRVVILDPKEQCGFLLTLLKDKGYTVFETDAGLAEKWQTVEEELLLRYEAESQHKRENVVFHVTRERDNLSFLFDYCFTHGCLDLSNYSDWLKKKLFANTGLQVQMDSSMLLIAGKLGIGKDITWWKKIVQNLEDLLNLHDELIPFLHEPEGYLSTIDDDIRSLFEKKLFELLEQPYMKKPPKTVADEVVKKILDGLVYNNISEPLLNLYYRWTDSEFYCPSLKDYIAKYKLDKSVDPCTAHPHHCFEELDRKALKLLTLDLMEKSNPSEKLKIIKQHTQETKVKRFVPTWWQDVIFLLEFDMNLLTTCNSFIEVVEFYTNSFAKVDRAIRNLYAEFLQEEAIIRPLQEHYESLNYELLQKWFELSKEYKSDQQGYLKSLFKKVKPGVAIIVGDGIRYEIAEHVATELKKHFKIEKQVMLADMPSETEHNMSALYIGCNEDLSLQKEREKRLSDISGKEIVYMDLEALSYGEKADFIILTYKDIDSAGEKLQLGAIKLFKQFEQVLIEKIAQLLNMGYLEVHLVTDHGFVLTGILDEADKIASEAIGKKEIHERFIRTIEKQNDVNWIEFERHYGEYKFIYVAKSHRPFKSKGVYGFSHGGFTPQEVILPNFVFRKEKSSTSSIAIEIVNKSELIDVTGEFFEIKIQSTLTAQDKTSFNRKVQVAIYAENLRHSRSNILNMKSGDSEAIEFSFNGNLELKAVLLDAETQEQLDVATIRKSNARDFGGLL